MHKTIVLLHFFLDEMIVKFYHTVKKEVTYEDYRNGGKYKKR